jgi:hypothetical protein
MLDSNPQTALYAIEKVLALLRSVQTLEGFDKDSVEYLLELAEDSLKRLKAPERSSPVYCT